MKILIVTLADEPYWPIARISVPNKAAYAAKHGYDFKSCTRSLNVCRPTSWSKLKSVADALSYYDLVFWTDSDSLIMNSDLKLETIIEDMPDKDLIAARDNNGLNFGQFIAFPRSQNLLDLADKHLELTNNPWWEQAAMQIEILKNDWEKHLGIADQADLNRLIPNGPEHNTLELIKEQVESVWRAGDLILHFAGMGGNRAHLRLEAMKFYAQHAQ